MAQTLETAETITVGSELTRGQNVDTHSALLARALGRCGLRVRYQTSVGDLLEEISEAIALALKRADCVIVTGGLGPTLDDLSREAVAAAVGRPLREDAGLWKEIQDRFAALGRTATENNRRQAMVVVGSEVLPNAKGSAPGLRLELDQRVLFALPGPSQEMEAMLESSVVPYLMRRQARHASCRRLQVYGYSESAVDAALRHLVPEGDSSSLALLAKGSYVEVILSALEAEPALAERKVELLEGECLDILGERVYSLDGRNLEQVVIDLLKEQRLTLAVAESCTGGLLASRLSTVPGASEVFWGGVVAYANEVKELLLEVPPFVLKKAGAVSKDCSLAMAVGLARKLDADYSLAITGIAGPGGASAEKPVGTVHLALAGPAGVTHQSCLFSGSDRKGVQARAAQAALWLVYCALADLSVEAEGSDRGGFGKAAAPAKGRG